TKGMKKMMDLKSVFKNMESFALYFMLGVCSGLLVALCLLLLGISCRPRTRAKSAADRRQLREPSEDDEEEAGEEGESFASDDEVPRVTVAAMSERSQSNGTLRSVNVFASAEELERARRLEERERILREIWRNGQPDILATGTGTLGRVHYH
uniref:EVA1 domain-containing protein n=1 Tax=Denticeps clupeoides TaxID=299321 RepID=A0AAY4DQV7_9TELE